MREQIVFVNGTFDIIHAGHLELLRYAKTLGDRLYVGIDSDERVSKLKGPDRPINKEHERFLLLSHLKPVDKVFIFHSDEELIDLIRNCDMMVKGSDYIGKPIVGQDVCKSIIFFEKLNGYSTTEKIKSIINR
jgi:D-beta-D-heptose 7-phosphate kinase/D-beta-D-heptose 1-phosphate adenosyltransferase